MKTAIALLALAALAFLPGCSTYKLPKGTKIVFATEEQGQEFRNKTMVDSTGVGRWITLDRPIRVTVP